jgi:hypothetical protein
MYVQEKKYAKTITSSRLIVQCKVSKFNIEVIYDELDFNATSESDSESICTSERAWFP